VASRLQDQVVRRVSRVCASDLDATALRVDLLSELRRAVDFDAFVWVLTDPQTCVGAAPLADVPCLHELPRLIRLKYLTELNRWTALARRQVALLHHDTSGELSRSRVWRELLAAYDVRDVASTVFRDRFGCWGFLDLWRTGGRQPFARSEAELVAAVVPEVTTALRQAQAVTFTQRRRNPRPHPGAAVLLLSPSLEVRAQTKETRDYLADLLPPTGDRPPVPAIAYNAAAQLLANEEGVDHHAPSTRVHLADGQWLTLRAARMGDGRDRVQRDIAVTIEETAPAERLPVFAAASGFTRRETEVLEQLAVGRDTHEIAAALVVSEHTVRDHLKSMFAKAGTRSRGALLTAALGTPQPGGELDE
jgi:DNA-binding CsgD family transcriptional regulator